MRLVTQLDSNPMEERVSMAPSTVELAKFEMVTLLVDPKNQPCTGL